MTSILHRSRSRPRELRVMLLSVALPLLPLFLLHGNENELRVFAPCVPAAMLMAAYTLRGILGDPVRES